MSISSTSPTPPSKLVRQRSSGNSGSTTTNNAGRKTSSSKYILGIDVGTTSVKICLVEAKSGEVSDKFVKDTMAAAVSDCGPAGDLQDPGKIYSALHACMARMPKEKLRRVCHIAVCGQMHGVLFWKHGRGWSRNPESRDHLDMGEVSPLFTWQDSRCDEDFLQKLPQPASHLRLATGYGCATIFWLQKNKPDFLLKYDRCGTVMDFLVTMLTEGEEVIMSSHNAASWGYYDTVQKSWNEPILLEHGFPVSLLPKVVDAGTDAGTLVDRWFGVPEGIPVTASMGDLQCSVRSTLIDSSTDAVLNISTSAQMAFVKSAAFVPDRQLFGDGHVIEYLSYFQDRYLAVAASLTGGNALAAFVKMIQHWVVDLGLSIPQSKIWEKTIALGAASAAAAASVHPPGINDQNGVNKTAQPVILEPGSSPSFCLSVTDPMDIIPTLHGERHEPGKRASASNITPANLGLGQVTRSICHGIVRNLAEMMPPEMLHEAGLTRIVGSGACLTRNPALKSQVQEVYQLPVVFAEEGSACIGAALAVRDLNPRRKRTRSERIEDKTESPKSESP